MVRVSTVSIVYNLRTDQYGVRKCINNGDTSFSQMLLFLTSLKSNQSNFQLHWSKRKVVSSIQTYPSKKPSVGFAYCRKTLTVFAESAIVLREHSPNNVGECPYIEHRGAIVYQIHHTNYTRTMPAGQLGRLGGISPPCLARCGTSQLPLTKERVPI